MLEENKENWMLFGTVLVLGWKSSSLAEGNSLMPSTVPIHSGSHWGRERIQGGLK